MRSGILKRRASMSKTTKAKNNVDTMLGELIEGSRLKQTRWSVVEVASRPIEGRLVE